MKRQKKIDPGKAMDPRYELVRVPSCCFVLNESIEETLRRPKKGPQAPSRLLLVATIAGADKLTLSMWDILEAQMRAWHSHVILQTLLYRNRLRSRPAEEVK
eukprot:1143616-Pelagomonas_calceolata.AAC.7